MSVADENVEPEPDGPGADQPEAAVDETLAVRRVPLAGSTVVERFLPTRRRSTVGAWCFLDHFGPDDVSTGPGMAVGPHPHIGLQTVTWLFDGRVVHRDSLANTQDIVPGQLNLMTAGAGIVHAEVSPVPRPRWLHGVQLWVALPDAHRHVGPAFEHHPTLPRLDLGGGSATVMVGELGGVRAPPTTYSALVGADVALTGPGARSIPLDGDFEYAVVGIEGPVDLAGRPLEAGQARYLGRSRQALAVSGPGRFLLLGGEPFAEPLVMWWNFVGRDHDEIVEARADWEAGRRFVALAGAGSPVPAPPLPPGRLVVRR